MEEKKKQSHFSEASLCLVCHLMKSDLFLSNTNLVLVDSILYSFVSFYRELQMLRMFSLFARTEFIWLTMFCSDA